MNLHFETAFLNGQWSDRVLIEVDDSGVIGHCQCGVNPTGDCESIKGFAIPGMTNVHSHAFQRALAGLAEHQSSGRDSFWTWRRLMYELVQQLTPEGCYAIARQLYIEMLKAGYTSVGEFHYIHRQPDGKLYDEPTTMSDVLIRAALDVGIGICLIPVLYQTAGFDRSPLTGGQLRFALSNDEILEMVGSLDQRYHAATNVNIGIAFHSLRAVDMNSIADVVNGFQSIVPNGPIHIHIAEQILEVDDCVAATGLRPVELLCESQELDDCWCLIHATHLTDHECDRLAKCGAVVGLCPTTEANLGDGVFGITDFTDQGGSFAIGSDSQISVDPRSELRLIEYNQRLQHRQRAILCSQKQSTGRFLYESTAADGAKALGIRAGRIAAGYRADIVVLDSNHPSIAGCGAERVLDCLVFCEHGNPLHEVFVGGKRVIHSGLHAQESVSRENFATTRRSLHFN